MDAHRRQELVRVAAPVAFLLVATIAILLIRSGLHHGAAAPKASTLAKKHRPAPSGVVPVAAATTQAAHTVATVTTRTYIVKAGDTLGSIATQLRTTVPLLLRANPGITPTNLQIGDKISLP
jgi:N-acetylmuramoyl-L-alanine amidase